MSSVVRAVGTWAPAVAVLKQRRAAPSNKAVRVMGSSRMSDFGRRPMVLGRTVLCGLGEQQGPGDHHSEIVAFSSGGLRFNLMERSRALVKNGRLVLNEP